LLIRRLSSTGVFVVVILIIIAIIIDTSIINIVTSAGGLRSSASDIALFVSMVLVFGVGQYIVMSFLKQEYEDEDKGKVNDKDKITGFRLGLDLINKVVTITQYVLLAILVFAILQMLFIMSYHILILKATIIISYGLTFILLALLASRFLSWFKSNRNLVVLAYALAISMISMNAVITIIYTNNELTKAPTYIRPVRSPTGAYTGGEITLNSTYVITSVISFLLTWIATVLLLRHYSRKLGRIKYWIIVSIPLAYFLSQFQPLFLYSFAELRISDPVLFGIIYNLIFSVSKAVGGVLFGIAFWTVSRHLTSKRVRTYMIISAYGMTLLFAANQPTSLILVPYPPFGLASICFMVLATYLVFLGIYSSAISVAEDSRLRRSIRKIALKESQFLDVIGTAEMEQEIMRRAIPLFAKVKDRMLEETGISSSVEEDDMTSYLQEVLEEVKKNKEKYS
jgi:MFS family permease